MRARLARLLPRRRPPAGAVLAYLAGLLLALLLIRPGAFAPSELPALAPEPPRATAPGIAAPPPAWLLWRPGGEMWAELLRLTLPCLSADPGGQGALPPAFAWRGPSFANLVSLLAGGFRWDDPFSWLAASLPALARPAARPGPSEEPSEVASEAGPEGDVVLLGSDPLVLVYHTHATESFLPELPRGSPPFSSDRAADVVRVGDELARELARLGVGVVHSRALYDAEGRVGAYERSLAGILPLLSRYPSLRLVVDLHRDSAERAATTAVVGGETVARVLLVVGTDKLLPHPGWRENAAFAAVVADAIERRAPGLVRRPDGQPYLVEDGRYNQQVAPGALLLEVGGVGNTMAEELRTARIVAPVLAELLREGRVPPRAEGGAGGR
ncbi:MAG: stage II sporulation protein P [Clostridia bacterium]|nr:stage II sporulation protein P [Clostridia bacterium]